MRFIELVVTGTIGDIEVMSIVQVCSMQTTRLRNAVSTCMDTTATKFVDGGA
jgi:hypothetical protein